MLFLHRAKQYPSQVCIGNSTVKNFQLKFNSAFIAVDPHENAATDLTDISKTISYISRGVELNQPRLIQRAIRQVHKKTANSPHNSPLENIDDNTA